MKHKLNTILFLILIVLEVCFISDRATLINSIILTFVVFSLIVGAGVVFLKLNYFVKSINRTNSEKVLLTFDDGPDPENTRNVLAILREKKVGAVFFLIANKVEDNQEIVKEIIADGHVIGNHSFGHNNFMAFFSTKALVDDLKKADDILDQLAPDRPKLFRPPIGYTTPNFTRALKKLKLHCMGWSLRSYDTLFKTPEKLIQRMIKSTRNGDIVLFHDNLPITSTALEKYIEGSRKNGIIFVSPEEINTCYGK